MSVERQRTDKARSFLAMEALKNDMDYLFFVDDDNPIPPDTLEKFIEDDKDVVIAPIPSRNPDASGKHPLCAFYASEINTSIGKVNIYHPIEKFREDGPLHRIDAGGTGCMLIKKKVLQKLNTIYQDNIFEYGDIKFEKLFIDGKEYDRRTMSEDAEFCERAVKAGFEIWLDDRIRPAHQSTVNYVRYQ